MFSVDYKEYIMLFDGKQNGVVVNDFVKRCLSLKAMGRLPKYIRRINK